MNPYSIEKTPLDVLELLAQKVKLLRKERKMSQAELARRSKVSLGSYKRFETTGHISLDSLLRIAFILGWYPIENIGGATCSYQRLTFLIF